MGNAQSGRNGLGVGEAATATLMAGRSKIRGRMYGCWRAQGAVAAKRSGLGKHNIEAEKQAGDVREGRR